MSEDDEDNNSSDHNLYLSLNYTALGEEFGEAAGELAANWDV